MIFVLALVICFTVAAGLLALVLLIRRRRGKRPVQTFTKPVNLIPNPFDTATRRRSLFNPKKKDSFVTIELAALTTVDEDLGPETPAHYGLRLDKRVLTFGANGAVLPLDFAVTDEITITNIGSKPTRIEIFPLSEDTDTHELINSLSKEGRECFTGAAKMPVNARCILRSTLLFKCTTNINEEIRVQVGERTKPVGGFIIQVIAASAVSARIDFNDLHLENTPIGNGSYGTVYKGTYRNMEVAVKMLKDAIVEQQGVDAFQKEVDLLSRLRNKYIVTFYGAVFSTGMFSIVTEFVRFGSLGDALKKEREKGRTYSDAQRFKYALDCAQGMAYLHSMKVMHRDLKPDNALVVNFSAKADICLKLTDFGTAKEAATNITLKQTKAVGTPIFMAPELLTGEDDSNVRASKADVYSYAVFLYELFGMTEPYSFMDSWKIPEYIIEGKRLCTEQIKPNIVSQMIDQCWTHRPINRPDFPDLLPILQKEYHQALEKKATAKQKKK
jgi:hypothetical protein